MSLKRRLEKLEKSMKVSTRTCPECRYVPGTFDGFEISCPLHGIERLHMPVAPQLCKTCGRSMQILFMECDCEMDLTLQPDPDPEPVLSTLPE